MPSPDRPLVSFVLLAYNQEALIREAVEGAFSQTYSPLEIILSDDCSKDRTFEIIQQMAATYHGPHKIVLNRNPKNLGIGGHVNRVNELVKGQLIVVAAGDDISMSQRVQKLAAKWLEDPKQIHLVYSDCEKINNDGSFLLLEKTFRKLDFIESFVKNDSIVLGAVCAWNRACFDRFGPILDGINHEDAVIPFRAAALGKIAFVAEALIKYRSLAGSTVQDVGVKLSLGRLGHLKHDLDFNILYTTRQLRAESKLIEQKKLDLLKISSLQELIEMLEARAIDVANQSYLLTGPSLTRKISILLNSRRDFSTLTKLLIKGTIANLLNIRVGRQRRSECVASDH